MYWRWDLFYISANLIKEGHVLKSLGILQWKIRVVMGLCTLLRDKIRGLKNECNIVMVCFMSANLIKKGHVLKSSGIF